MDWIAWKDRFLEYIKKFRHVLLVLAVGLFLMLLPSPEEPEIQEPPSEIEESSSLQDDLAEILSNVSGAGKVQVLLTQSIGEETLYQTDEDVSKEDIRRDTVLITNSDREETGLIRQINPPVYLGAVVLCQGADNANVRLSLVEAVMSVTGLSSDRITVLKMK